MADRIEAIRRTIPPPDGRQSRLGYISKDDFAELVGASRTRVIAWTKGKSFPEKRYRERLAELSNGLNQPDDFARDAPAGAAHLEEVVVELGRLVTVVGELATRVEALERRFPAERTRGARPR